MLSFSVVTCTRNSIGYIDECIDSVQNQLYELVEQVFIDGDSTDGTLDRIRSIGGRSRYLTGIGGGIAKAMNVGAQVATGDVVVYLHSDDYFLDNNVISRVAEAMDRVHAKWLYGRVASDIEGRIVFPNWVMPKYSPRALLRRNFIPHPATFVRRELMLQTGGFDSTLKYAMDYDLWLRLAKISEPVYLDSFLTAFRRHEGSASTANALAAFEEDQVVRLREIGSDWSRRAFHTGVHCWRRYRQFGLGAVTA